MSEAIPSNSVLREAHVEEDVAYRAICPSAVGALLLGAASAAALAHPGLWIVPAVAVAVSLWALRTIAVRKNELIGRRAALLGLALAVLFGAWAPARLVSRQSRLYATAKSQADAWLALIREDKLYEAYELHLKPADRQPADVSLAERYGDLSVPASGARMEGGGPQSAPPVPGSPQGTAPMRPGPQFAIRDFFAEPAMKALVAAVKSGEISFQGFETLESRPESSSENIFLRYELPHSEKGKAGSQILQLVLTRTLDSRSRKANWFIASVFDPSAIP